MPAPASTTISRPSFVKLGITPGTNETRRSPGKLSRGTPTIMQQPPTLQQTTQNIHNAGIAVRLFYGAVPMRTPEELSRATRKVLAVNHQGGPTGVGERQRLPQTLRMSATSMVFPRREIAAGNIWISERLFCVLVFSTGFFLRLAFMLWHKLYVFYPTAIYENIKIAASLVAGNGFSSPFGVDTGPTAWVAPGYPFLIATVFKA